MRLRIKNQIMKKYILFILLLFSFNLKSFSKEINDTIPKNQSLIKALYKCDSLNTLYKTNLILADSSNKDLKEKLVILEYKVHNPPKQKIFWKTVKTVVITVIITSAISLNI